MNPPYQPPPRSWRKKFADAFSGIALGMRGQASFAVHVPAAVAVLIAGAAFRVSPWEWCVLLLCIALVLSLELLNSALEHLAKAATQQYDEQVRRALHIASGAVLVAAIFAAAIGLVIFLPKALALLSASITS